MARLMYTLLLYLITPLILGRLLWRSRRAPAYARRWAERFGFVPTPGRDEPDLASSASKQKTIWVHAVSVGETLAAVPLIKALQSDYPDAQLVVTTTTPTGSEQVVKIFGDSVAHVYAPYDLPDVLARFFARVRPSIVIIMETELWPNLLSKCRRSEIPVVIANARLSEKSAAGYRKIAWLMRGMLADISFVAAQSIDDGERFINLGLSRDKLVVTGNIKFDLQLDAPLVDKSAALKAQWQTPGQRLIWLAASTHQGEDEIILDAFAQVLTRIPDTLLVLVPRHPERFNDVATLCVDRGFSLVRRSEHCLERTGLDKAGSVEPGLQSQILLGDTMGELLAFFGASDIAFIGGSLVPVGGHNLIEPAAWGIPILTGPNLFNFAEVAAKLTEAGAMQICENAAQLGAALIDLLGNAEEPAIGQTGIAAANLNYQAAHIQNNKQYKLMADAAHSVAEGNRGALLRLTQSLAKLLD